MIILVTNVKSYRLVREAHKIICIWNSHSAAHLHSSSLQLTHRCLHHRPHRSALEVWIDCVAWQNRSSYMFNATVSESINAAILFTCPPNLMTRSSASSIIMAPLFTLFHCHDSQYLSLDPDLLSLLYDNPIHCWSWVHCGIVWWLFHIPEL